MKRSRAPSQVASQTVTTTTVKKAKPVGLAKRNFRQPSWAGPTKTGFPKELRIKHRYVQTVRLISTAGSLAKQVFSCNGMYDPDITGTGHQPYYFDDLSALYNHYTVLKSKITCDVVATGTIPFKFGIMIDDDTSAPANADTLAESPNSSYGVVDMQGSGPKKFRKSWVASQNFGPNAIGDPNLQGTSAANPSEQQFYHLWAQTTDGASTSSLDVQVTIEFEAIWQELKTPSGS